MTSTRNEMDERQEVIVALGRRVDGDRLRRFGGGDRSDCRGEGEGRENESRDEHLAAESWRMAESKDDGLLGEVEESRSDRIR